MLSLLGAVADHLAARSVGHALIGAGALAAHGVSRSTSDLDLLTTAREVLDPAFWIGLAAAAPPDIRAGGPDDPLAGVVRVSAPGARSVDLVVGRHAWQADVVRRARPITLAGRPIPVATAPDLVLLKLFAGSPQDAWDVEQILAARDRAAIASAVEADLPRLPPEAARLWARIVGG